jgi:hypothetical protein
MERLQAGFVDVVNPFNSAQTRRVSLLPEDVDAFVFWTRDPRAVAANAEKLRPYRFYVMTTVTGYPEALEPNAPPVSEITGAMGELAEKIGARRVIWRYDPVFLSTVTGFEFHRQNFRNLAGALKGSVRRVIVSLYKEYRGAERRITALEKAGVFRVLPFRDENGGLLPPVRDMLGALASEASAAGMEIQGCASEEPGLPGIGGGACIDGELIRELGDDGAGSLFPGVPGGKIAGRDRNQRPECRCVPSVDIGRYGNCPAACVYCYARSWAADSLSRISNAKLNFR